MDAHPVEKVDKNEPSARSVGEPHEVITPAGSPPSAFGVRRQLLWFVLPISLLALLLGTSFIARTRHVAGPRIEALLTREASRRGVELYIASMRPVGLFGVRMENVRARLRRGSYLLDTRLDHLDITPDLWASLRAGRPVPRQISLDQAYIVLERATYSTPSPEDAASQEEGDPAHATLGLEAIKVVGKDVRIALKAGSFATMKPLNIHRIEAELPLVGAPLPRKMSAYGELPDGVPFAMFTRLREASGEEGSHIVLEPQRPTRIAHWFEGQLPFDMTVARVTLCSGCEQDGVAFEQVDIDLPNLGKGLHFSVPDAQLVWHEGQGVMSLDGVQIEGMRSELELAMERLRLEIDPERGEQRGELFVREGTARGQLGLSWTWVNQERFLHATLTTHDFALRPMLELLDVKPLFHAGRVSGTATFDLDLHAALLDARTSLEFQDAAAAFPLLTPEEVRIPVLVLDSDFLVDLKGRAVSMEHLEVGLKDLRPLRLKAHLIDASQGWRFDVHAMGRDIESAALLDALPEVLVRPMRGTRSEGHFGFDIIARGHSAYPESLDLQIDVDGDVTILDDGPAADIRALSEPGYPVSGPQSLLALPITPEQWVALSDVPHHVPSTVLAAEDAAFYKHDGFDFGGLARAMIHNLKVGRMERGGSTITQQLVKNLFLSHDRTAARKMQEAYLTWRIEQALSKQRILEIYLNMVHWGDEVYGLRAAAQHYFQREPEDLGVDQVALLGAILPNPERFGGHIEQGFVASSRVEKFEHVMANLRFLGAISMQDYNVWMSRARRGQIGNLELTVCKDDEHAPQGAPPCP